MSDNLPDIIKANPNALIYAKKADFDTADIFRTEITVMPIDTKECHNIGGNLVPNKAVTDRMSDAAGIDFVSNEQTGVSIVPGTRKYVGRVRGRKRNPDGTWRYSPVCEYEFDIDVRAEEDFLRDAAKDKADQKYTTETAKKLHVIELEKAARARADTGARLRAIRELIGMPTGFKPADISGKKLVFSRVAVDANRLLQDPEMRRQTIQHALGVTENLFGPKEPRNVTPAKLAIEAAPESMEPAAQAETQPAAEAEPVPETDATDLFEDDLPWEQQKPADRLKTLLKSCKKETEERALAWLAKNPSDAEIEEKIKALNAAIDKTAHAAQAKGATA
jgi:hypothetical protein